MPARGRALGLLFALIVSHCAAGGSTPAAGPRAGAGRARVDVDARAIDVAVWDEIQRQRVIGVAVAVVRDRKIVHVRGYGFADREACTPVTKRTLFRWASLSKPLTAIAAMQLWEQGKLDLDRDVRELVPEYPDQGKPITARMLLSHQGGVPHDIDPTLELRRGWWNDPQNDPVRDVVRAIPVFADKPLVYPPGQRFYYSTPGYVLLSAVVQRAGEAPFVEQVRERIAGPLAMESLQPDRLGPPIGDRAAGYRMVRDSITRVRALDVGWKLGGGGFCSNIEDAARFAEGILNFRLLAESTFRTMWTPLNDSNGKATHYGLGFQVDHDARGQLRVWHEGYQAKSRTRMVLYPDTGAGIVILSNTEHADTAKFVQAIEAALRQAEDDE